MLTIRYWVRLFTAFLKKFWPLILAGGLIGVAVFAILRFLFPVIFSHNELVGMVGRYHTDSLPTGVLKLIGEGLTNIDEHGQVTPGLAESWKGEDNGKTWIFTLKQGLKWQDGTPVTSKSIQYSFEDVTTETPNDQTIIFKLSSEFSPFPTIVSRPTFKRGLLGTGDWRVQKISLAATYVEMLVLKNEIGETKTIKFYPTEERAKLAYELGEVDRLADIINPSPLDTWNTALVDSTSNSSRFVAIFLNTAKSDNNILADKKVRQALSYAIDKKSLSNSRAIGPISPMSWAYNPQIKDYAYDASRAKELLSDIPKAELEASEVKLVTNPALLEVADKIKLYWEAVGVTTTVLVSSTIPTDYQAFLAIYDIPSDPDQYSTWHSTQTETNISHYQNPRIDTLLEQGRTELDQEKRKKIYLDFQRFLLEDAPAIFLYHPASYSIQRK